MILKQVRRRAKKGHLAVIIIIIIIFKAVEGKKGNYKSGFFPQLILTKEKKEQIIGMLLNIWLEAAHLVS